MLRLRNETDFFAGLLFIAIGGFAGFVARDYRFGTAMQMGPGFLPLVLAAGVMLIGVVVAIGSFSTDGPKVSRIGWRPLVLVLGAMVLFGMLVDRMGLVLAIMATVMTGGFAFKGSRIWELIALAVLLSAFSVGLFVVLLGQTIPIWPRW